MQYEMMLRYLECNEEEDIAMSKKSVFILIQEGGATGELYIHAWDTAEEAEQDRIDCARDGAYSTSPVMEIPASLNTHEFYEVADELVRNAYQLECVEVPEDDTDPMDDEPFEKENNV